MSCLLLQKRKASFGQNRKVNRHMCPVWHLQTSDQSLQHLEGPISFCMFWWKVADLVCWALRTHRTACNTAKPVNEALKPKSCTLFTYHSHLFTSIHLFPHGDFVWKVSINDVSEENTAVPNVELGSQVDRSWPELGTQRDTTREPRWGWCDVNGCDVTYTCLYVGIYLDQGDLSDDIVLYLDVTFLSPMESWILATPPEFRLSPVTYKFEASLCRAHAKPKHLVVFAWKSLKKICHSQVKSRRDIRLALCQRIPLPDKTFLHGCKEVIRRTWLFCKLCDTKLSKSFW